jgi:tetratricopeptide (TPR) repeat protein
MNTLLRQAVFNIMESPKINVVAGLLVFVAVLQTPSAAQSGPGSAPSSTVPPSALPPSYRREGLIRTPDPMDRTSELAITGNVRGGKYFRGSVPYSTSRYFEGTTPSSSLDSFIRDSAGAEDISSFSSRYKPYYSQSRTVTTTQTGSSKVTRPPHMNIGEYTPQAPTSETSTYSRTDTTPDTGYIIPTRRSRPMSMTIQEIEAQISSDTDEYSQLEKPAGRQYQPLTEQFKYKITEKADGNAPDISGRLTAQKSPLMPPIKKERLKDTQQAEMQQQSAQEDEYDEESSETPPTAKLWTPEERQPKKEMDVYEQMKQQLDVLEKKIDLALAREKDEKEKKEQDEDALGSLSRIPKTPIGQSYEMPESSMQQQDLHTGKASEIDPSITKRAKEILGPYHTFTSFSESSFNKNMAAAELYLKQGRYYRAADAYTLASIYKPDDPLPYAGKSHALFASGEYMSSALFLSRALNIFPGYAQLKIDIAAMTGGAENLEARVADVEEWLGRSNAPELHFLLAYIYHQMNETDRAKKAINAAYEKAPDMPAVLTLKKAIEDNI